MAFQVWLTFPVVVLKDAELIPEYGYHENCPVIYVRKAGIGGYSIQSGSKARPLLSSAELCPITLYYKFKNVGGKLTPIL